MNEHENHKHEHDMAGHDHGDHAASGHAGHHAHMVADFKRRFWISLILTIPILLLSPLVQELLGIEDVIAFMSDPVLSQAHPRAQLSGPVEHMYGVERPIISQVLLSIFSAVFVPTDQMAYIAMGAEPAQAGTYWPINLTKQLALMQTLLSARVEEGSDEKLEKSIKKLSGSTSDR